MNKLHLHEELKKWGASKRILPENNSAMKSEVLSKAPDFIKSTVSAISYPWASIAFASMAVLIILVGQIDPGSKIMTTPPVAPMAYEESAGRTSGSAGAPTMPSFAPTSQNDAKMGMSLPPYYNGNPSPITDTREFLKTYYNAEIKTRNVEEKADRAEIAIRGLGGRIDTSNKGKEYAYLSFALPAGKLDLLRSQIKDLEWDKLVIEQVSSENLLPQKQSIESDRENVETNIDNLKSEKSKLTKNHNSIVNGYLAEIKKLDNEASALQYEWPSASPERRMQISARLADIQIDKEAFQTAISRQRSNYNEQLSYLNSQIKNWETSLGYVEKQDENLTDNLATVNGTISLDKVNLWEIGEAYAPGPLLAWILGLLALLSYIRYRTSFGALI